MRSQYTLSPENITKPYGSLIFPGVEKECIGIEWVTIWPKLLGQSEWGSLRSSIYPKGPQTCTLLAVHYFSKRFIHYRCWQSPKHATTTSFINLIELGQ